MGTSFCGRIEFVTSRHSDVCGFAGPWRHICSVLDRIQEGRPGRIRSCCVCDQCDDIGCDELADVGCLKC